MAYFSVILIVMFIPWNIWALSQRQMFSKKDGKTNNFAVDVAVLAMEKGEKVDKEWLDPVLFNSVSVIHDNGVVELRYANGSRSYSVAGTNSRIKFKQAGALFPKGWLKEDVGGTEITHVQTRPFFDRVKLFIKKILPISYKWDTPVEYFELSQMDKYLLDMILSGNEEDREYMLKNFGHKVCLDNPMGNTIYLTLDNPIKENVTILRCRGVMPKRKLFGKAVTSFSISRVVEITDKGPVLKIDIDRNSPVGTFHLDSMKGDSEASIHFGGDVSFGVGKYKMNFRNGKAGFSVFGMEGDDIRLSVSGRNTVTENKISKDISPIESPMLFYELGKRLRELHSVGIIHGKMQLGSIGVRESYGRKLPIFRDLENAFRLTIDTEIHERAAWMFSDLAGPISEWSRIISPGIYTENNSEQFLNGYFSGQASKAVLWECVSSDFFNKLRKIEDGGIVIQDVFPHLYNALLSVEMNEWMEIHMEDIEKQLMLFQAIQNITKKNS